MSLRTFYSESELLCLQGLVRKYGLHQNSMSKPSEKKMAWSHLSTEFNSVKANSHRTDSQLRKCWANLKSRKKAVLVPENTEKTTEEKSQRPNNDHCSCSTVAVAPFFTEREKQCLNGLIRKFGLHLTSTYSYNESAKKQAWIRVTKEFNSNESNSRRTEAQLKKWWFNHKMKKKNILARLKRTRSQPEGSPSVCEKPEDSSSNFETESEISYPVIENAEDPLANEVKPNVDCDSIPDETPADVLEVLPPEMVQEQMALALNIKNEPPRSSAPSPSCGENDHADTDDLQQVNSKRIEEREEELHRLQVAEREWLVKAAKETYLKARLERESAEELLGFRKAKREEAERKMNKD